MSLIYAVVLAVTLAAPRVEATPSPASPPRGAVNPWVAGSTAAVLRLHPWVVPTPPRPRPATRATRAPTVSSSGSVNGYPCGGSLPTCAILRCESGGNPTADNPRSSASGLWQILDSTWNGYGGYSRAKYAPASVQNAKAAAIWNGGAGRSQWSC